MSAAIYTHPDGHEILHTPGHLTMLNADCGDEVSIPVGTIGLRELGERLIALSGCQLADLPHAGSGAMSAAPFTAQAQAEQAGHASNLQTARDCHPKGCFCNQCADAVDIKNLELDSAMGYLSPADRQIATGLRLIALGHQMYRDELTRLLEVYKDLRTRDSILEKSLEVPSDPTIKDCLEQIAQEHRNAQSTLNYLDHFFEVERELEATEAAFGPFDSEGASK
jgi:hypothetical protein